MTGNFFQISSSSVSFLLASVGTLVSNALPVILPLIGLFVAWAIIEGIIGLSRGRGPKTTTYTLGEYQEKIKARQARLASQGGNFLEPQTFELSEEEEEEEFGED